MTTNKAGKAPTKTASAKLAPITIKLDGLPLPMKESHMLLMGLFDGMSRDQLVEALKARQLGVPKLKVEMQFRLAKWTAAMQPKVSVTIG